MVKEDRLCKLRKRIYMRLYFSREISIGETNTKSCKVTTIVNTNHFPQNLKQQYRFSLAIVVPQSGNHFYSGDRPFEWPTLSDKKWQMKALTMKFTRAHLHKHVFCGALKYFIILLDEYLSSASYLLRLFDDFNHFTTFIQCKTDEKVSSSGRTVVVKTQFVPRTISLENRRVH